MEIKHLEQILSILKHSDITELELDQDGTHLKVSRGPRHVVGHSVSVAAPTPIVEPAIVGHVNGISQGSAAPAAASATPAINPNFTKVESPIVGTFYRKPSPDADFFVNEGDRVKKGDTLCIIEAMKLMNEIESPCDGRVEKILLPDGKVVEFGEVIFLINPTA